MDEIRPIRQWTRGAVPTVAGEGPEEGHVPCARRQGVPRKATLDPRIGAPICAGLWPGPTPLEGVGPRGIYGSGGGTAITFWTRFWTPPTRRRQVRQKATRSLYLLSRGMRRLTR